MNVRNSITPVLVMFLTLFMMGDATVNAAQGGAHKGPPLCADGDQFTATTQSVFVYTDFPVQSYINVNCPNGANVTVVATLTETKQDTVLRVCRTRVPLGSGYPCSPAQTCTNETQSIVLGSDYDYDASSECGSTCLPAKTTYTYLPKPGAPITSYVVGVSNLSYNCIVDDCDPGMICRIITDRVLYYQTFIETKTVSYSDPFMQGAPCRDDVVTTKDVQKKIADIEVYSYQHCVSSSI